MAKGPSLSMEKKMLILLVFFVGAAFTGLVGRLVYLQLVKGDFFERQAVEQQLRDITISPERGTIYDRNMKPLAESSTVWDVYVSPNAVTEDKTRRELSAGLAKLLDMNQNDVYAKISKKSAYEILKRKIEKPEADLVRTYLKDNKISCVGLVEDSKRYYPFGNFAAQILGFTGADNQGLAGIEAEYDSVLKGTAGRMVSVKNAKGTDMSFKYDDYIAPQSGTSLVLTIDEVAQHYLENHLADALVTNKVANKVTGIVMNVNTGEIVAMATEPDFDPNQPFTLSASDQAKLAGLSGKQLTDTKDKLLQAMWRNKAISDPYEPGSCFKVVTASAALEEKVVKENTTFFDPGYKIVAGRRISCWKAGGHGSETFLDGIKNSCNPVFMTIAEWMGPQNFFKYFSAFGLTQKTGIDLPGEAGNTGLYHTAADLGPVQLAVSSFGQTFKITPIQLITAVCAAANGGKLVTPHVVSKEIDSNGHIVKTFDTQVKRQAISAATSKELCGMLEQVVASGTGKNAYVAGYRVAGKTGTSQKMDVDQGKSLRIASFVGFAPADNPQYAAIVILDEPNAVNKYGGVIAAPVEGQIFSDILPYLGVKAQYTAKELADLDVKTPDLVGKNITEAQSALKTNGLNCHIVGSGDTVTSQMPVAGQSIPKSGTVILGTGAEKIAADVTVPDLTGLSANKANETLAELGLNIKFVGSNLSDTNAGSDGNVVAYQQDVAAGSRVRKGTVVTVLFRNNSISVD